jgi:hypothetical protein
LWRVPKVLFLALFRLRRTMAGSASIEAQADPALPAPDPVVTKSPPKPNAGRHQRTPLESMPL